MNLQFGDDRDLLFMLSTMGVRFLGLTYEAFPEPKGWALRVTDGATVLYFDSYETEQEVVDGAKFELETALYDFILGRQNASKTGSW